MLFLPTNIYNGLTWGIASVWFVNGFLCKILNFVERHEAIVSRILGHLYARPLTILIGFAEVFIACWYLTGFKRKLNASLQIAVVVIMNILEFFLSPDLLLWGRFNIIWSLLFAILVYFHAFKLKIRSKPELST